MIFLSACMALAGDESLEDKYGKDEVALAKQSDAVQETKALVERVDALACFLSDKNKAQRWKDCPCMDGWLQPSIDSYKEKGSPDSFIPGECTKNCKEWIEKRIKEPIDTAKDD